MQTFVRALEEEKNQKVIPFFFFLSFPFLSHSRETRWCGTSLRGRARLRNGEIERHVRGARVSNTWRVTLGSETGAREYSYRCYNRVDNVPFRRPSFFPPPPSLSRWSFPFPGGGSSLDSQLYKPKPDPEEYLLEGGKTK